MALVLLCTAVDAPLRAGFRDLLDVKGLEGAQVIAAAGALSVQRCLAGLTPITPVTQAGPAGSLWPIS